MLYSLRLSSKAFGPSRAHVSRFLKYSDELLTLSIVRFNSNGKEMAAKLDLRDLNSRFLYFAFGSNLLEERLHLSCPSAARLSAARLPGYALTFNYNSLRWRGHAATIKEEQQGATWGCIWSISKNELEALHM